MGKSNVKKKSFPLNQEPMGGPSVKIPKTMKPERMPKPTDVGPKKALDPVTYALQKDVDTLDEELRLSIREVAGKLAESYDIYIKALSDSSGLCALKDEVASLRTQFYVFVGLTIAGSIAINLLNWM